MVDTAGLQDWLALPGGSKSHSGKGNDEEDSGFKELHDWVGWLLERMGDLLLR